MEDQRSENAQVGSVVVRSKVTSAERERGLGLLNSPGIPNVGQVRV